MASSLRYFSFDYDQKLYEDFLAGKISKEQWESNVKSFTYGVPAFSDRPEPKNNIGVFTGLDTDGNKTIIVDANNNHDFGDDTRYTVKKGKEDTAYKLSLAGSYFNGRHIKDTLFSVLMIPKTNIIYNSDTLRQRLSVMFVNNAVLSAQLKIGNNTYRFSISKPLVPNGGIKEAALITVARYDDNGLELNSDIHQLGDTITIKGDIYRLNNISFATQYLQIVYLSKAISKGINVGETVYSFLGNDVIDAKPIRPEMFRGKYILLDFWGTWCKPCIEGIPEMVKLSKKYQDKLHIISIANDKVQQVAKLKKLITTKNMNWSNIWNDYNKGELVSHFNIRAFPTYILIDPNRQILFRNEGSYVLSGMQKLIK